MGFYGCITLKIAYTVDNQNFETASTLDAKIQVLKMKIPNFGLCENLMVDVCLGILNEHVEHLFVICQHFTEFCI